MTRAFSWQSSVSLCPASFCTLRPNLSVIPGISWLPTFTFQSRIMKRTFLWMSVLKGLVNLQKLFNSVQFSAVSVVSDCLPPVDCSTPGLPVHHQPPVVTQTHVHWLSDAIQPSHPVSSPSPPAFDLSQHWCLFHWVGSSHQVAKGLEFHLQHQSFQWIFRTDFL